MAIVSPMWAQLARLPLILSEGLRELALTGKGYIPERAARIGLVNDVYETGSYLGGGACHRGRDRRQPTAGGAGHQDVLDEQRNRPGRGQSALRRGVELGLPAIQRTWARHQGDVPAAAAVHRRVIPHRRGAAS